MPIASKLSISLSLSLAGGGVWGPISELITPPDPGSLVMSDGCAGKRRAV